MKVEILGSGGALTTPRPGCDCQVCVEARGPGYFLPMGLCAFHPLTAERRLHADHPLLRREATFEETLEIVENLGARRTVLSHIAEMDGLSYDDLCDVERRLDGRVEFAYDGMLLDV